MLNVKSLVAGTPERHIIENLSLAVTAGERLALMGPNGSGKSTLSHVLMGNPEYTVFKGSISYQGEDITLLPPEKRAALGIFLAHQHPQSLEGVTVSQFVRLCSVALAKQRNQEVPDFSIHKRKLKQSLEIVGLPWQTAERHVHVGMSGGEQKRLEVALALVFEPSLLILDEIDSGLDIDALSRIGSAVDTYLSSHGNSSLIVITHYDRLLTHLPVDRVAVLENGTIAREGNMSLAHTIQAKGYTHE